MKMDEIEFELLPASVRELVDVVGLQAVLLIVQARGGVRLCVPTKAKADHWLNRLIGMDALEALVGRYRGEEIEIPRCDAAFRAARENVIADSTESNAILARRYGYTERGIRKLKQRVRGKRKMQQGDLFSSPAAERQAKTRNNGSIMR